MDALEAFSDGLNASALAVRRALDDLRRGLPVRISAPGEPPFLAAAIETLSPGLFARARAENAHILLTPHRAATLHIPANGQDAVPIRLDPAVSLETLRAIGDPTLDLAMPLKGPFEGAEGAGTTTARAAIRLVKEARLLPAALLWPCKDAPPLLLSVAAEDVLSTTLAETLIVAARAKLPLEDAQDAALTGFRPASGGLEHVALTVGDPRPGDPVLVRIHSECFTGDLLGSLKCDCGDQLRGAIKVLREAGGGILLYLAQEGRGIGLMPKLKAYALQDQGYDTVDANTRLGFDVDERLFQPAAEMLKQLGFLKIRLLTNNPEKVEAMRRFGITVAERVPHAFAANPHNQAYLDVKRDRTGHLL